MKKRKFKQQIQPNNHAKQSAIDVLKTNFKIVIRKAAEAPGDLVGNKVADKILR